MSQEDDLRGLAKVIDFMRAISILFVLIHCYWFCYELFREWNITYRCCGQNTDELSEEYWTVLFIAMDQTLCCFVLRLVMSGHTWREGRENYMEKHYNTSCCGFHHFLS